MNARTTARIMIRDEIYDLFHDFWQIFTALKTYNEILLRSRTIIGEDRVVVEEVGRIIRVLQERAEGLRARVLNVIG